MFDLSGPIVRSRLEPDFYKFTMGRLIWRKYRDVQVTFSFTNRTARARLGRVVDIGELREQLEHARSLMFTNSERHYLRGTNQYHDRMFTEDYEKTGVDPRTKLLVPSDVRRVISGSCVRRSAPG